VKIKVFQGESNKTDECEMLGEFEFFGLPASATAAR
jgi:molecular chaperone DnaK (HSP70)